jgi:transcriptional regulator with XRE-family HTH domain
MSPLSAPQPSLGTVLKTFRATHGASMRELAMRLGLSLERLRALENDATLPNVTEVGQLSDALSIWPQRVLRAIRQTALDMLWDTAAVAANCHPRAVAARQLPPGPEAPPEGPATLPGPLRRTLARCLQVDPQDAAALASAWQALQDKPPEAQRIVYEATVSRLTLEGEPEFEL